MTTATTKPNGRTWFRKNWRWLLPIVFTAVCLPILCVLAWFRLNAVLWSDTLVDLAEQEDDYKTALNLYNLVVFLNPQSSGPYLARGAFFGEHGQMVEGFADLDRAINLDPNNPYNLIGRAWLFELQGDYEKSLDDLNQAGKLATNDHDILARKAIVLSLLGRKDEALAELTNAIKLVGNDDVAASRYYASRSRIQHDLGYSSAAFDDANRAVLLNGSNADAYYMRAYFYGEAGKSALAVADYTKAIELGHDDPFNYYQRGVHLQYLGDTEAAKRDFETFISLYDIDDEFSQYAKEQIK